jgi:tRNA (cytidine/uridine-2'-O-)-methyltransferase
MLHIALFEPEIAGNTGSVARTCLALGARLHLIRPLGFRLSDAALKRVAMDYWSLAEREVHDSFSAFYQRFEAKFQQGRVFSFSTKASKPYDEARFAAEDVLIFGPESRGLPQAIRDISTPLTIPMQAEARSLNLAVSVAVAAFEVQRQLRQPDG